MKLSQECILLQNELRKFAQQVLAEKADELDKSCTFPADNIRRLAEMGILGAVIPESYGGAALDTIGFAVILEEISKVCASTAFVVASHNAFFAYPLLKHGSVELQKKYLPRAATGEIIGAYALPKTSDIKIEKTNNGHCISGKNTFVINAAAKGPVIMVITDPGSEPSSIYVLDQNTTGCQFSKRSNTIGLSSAGIGEYEYRNCCPSTTDMIGQSRQGQHIVSQMHDYARILLAAVSVGIAEGARDDAVKYAKERVQFGQPVVDFGMVREQLADMTVQIEAARHLVYEAASRLDGGEEFRSAAAMAKLYAGQAATSVTTSAIQVYGGYGYIKDYPVERYFRDAQMINVVCSTPDEDKEMIAKEII
jgi:butyryl-CoA dehydrogenase